MRRHAQHDTPTVLFGAFDRHNFGDLLFPHVAERMLDGGDLRFAGLATRDLRRYGGHRVDAFARIAADSRGHALNVVHVGGELLTCNAWEAAVMLSRPGETRDDRAHADTWAQNGPAWAHARFGTASLAPYVLSRHAYPDAPMRRVAFNAVGGVALDAVDAALRDEVLAALAAADDVSVRDAHTHALLSAAGIRARLVPDPAAMTCALFGVRIRRHAGERVMREVLRAFPGGYAAVQFSADFGDDATLDLLAHALTRAAESHRLGIVLFRAGAAPWHDDLACYERIAGRMRGASVRLFSSLDLWDIGALIAGSRVYCGSSLHGRIVAMSFARPRVNVRHPGDGARMTKAGAYVATWEAVGVPGVVGVDDVGDAIGDALHADAATLEGKARELADLYREGFAWVRRVF
ncbi:polysaccharide pyruvyl transferase family protein [Burkholderia stagnalis]|uniref:polysaccharide pyruvyl transferase family protein n=1 Tax=Burkholderia stagnalis TaxID=1503054 RepID=UPI0007600AA5|nr:polysaccharide pyruvyl transferase family protein [Burkholderia stagnalis]KWK13195.1 chromosome condensation regulator RCC1 [Burkholderia stagnalis]KWO33482.1 chromosome condensation regulator RCC1 [Burkholderia stagnalis]